MPNFLYYGQLEYGHMNVGITLFQIFKKRYGDQYKIFFIVNENWHKRLKKIDPSIETLLLQPIEKQNTDQIDEEDAFELLVNSFCKCKSLEEQCDTIISTVNKFFLNSTNYYRLIQTQIEQFFKQIDFQLILVDSVIPVPFLMNKNIPCVSIVSMSCAGIGGYDNVPPSCSMIGFKEKHLWPKRKQEFIDGFHEYIDLMNKYLEDEGVNERLKPGCFMFAYPDLNIYLVPEEISYISNDKRDAIEKPYPTAKFDYDWIRIDSTIDSSSNIEPFELPKWFLELPGKIIYFSLGSNFCKNTVLMQKILDVLGGMPHKFIVSTGENGYRLKLPENCYGSSWLPQKSVLKVCDMMITHGGNSLSSLSFIELNY